MNYVTQYRAVYYGFTPVGKRLHLADQLFYQTGQEQWWAKAYCGTNIHTHSEGQAPPTRVSEFCRNCFRTLAWELFEDSLHALAQNELVAV